ncbi:putative transposase/invertase (TIGR01784 family) [Anaerobacterium chartisolvens]|uniref:Putative transposase/invertase (TIGR01784 family) n=1 Tax=Anaerobacterium chartisolvens TaxID=1297424 RepID=A0A369B8M6_9FIRM|nr:Rpn family recombination-promoting nuclease/putative transposase [Anaerobacterium chartisolvens]RCX17873.1 putative transposase/invertase (TIGR01784 family) [Anaerobacterium chartisolvens]
MKRLKVKNDFIFQRIFGQPENKEILISFLNAVLELEGNKRLLDIEIIENTRLKKEGINDKLGILDIRAKTMLGEHINIEVQLVNQYNMDKRTIFYWSKIFTEQLKEGQPFNELKKTITINILDFSYIDVDSYSTVFHLWEDRHKDCKLTDIMEVRFIELPKFRRAKPDLGKPLDRWLVFIEDSPEEMIEMAMREEPAIARAEEVLQYLGSFDEIRRYYEAREMAVHDEITRITGARQEGIEMRNIQIVKNMRSQGIKDDDIAKLTGLTVEEVENIK